MKTHFMTLAVEPFEKIQQGTKTVEIRLNDDKRKLVDVGDHIVFSCENETIEVEVIDLHRFDSFVDLFTTLGGVDAGWSLSDTPQSMSEDMRKYYSKEQEEENGVLGIRIELIKNHP